MALETMVEPSDAQQQLDLYNRSSTTLIKRSTYNPPADTAWAVVGCTLAGAVVPDDVPTIVSNIEALAQVTSVADPQFWGQAPATLLINSGEATHELKLMVETAMSCAIGYGSDLRSFSQKQVEVMKPPLDTKFLVMNIRVPAELDESAISALETAIGGVTGVGVCEHLVDGVVPSNASQVSLQIVTRMRIDAIEE